MNPPTVGVATSALRPLPAGPSDLAPEPGRDFVDLIDGSSTGLFFGSSSLSAGPERLGRSPPAKTAMAETHFHTQQPLDRGGDTRAEESEGRVCKYSTTFAATASHLLKQNQTGVPLQNLGQIHYYCPTGILPPIKQPLGRHDSPYMASYVYSAVFFMLYPTIRCPNSSGPLSRVISCCIL